ncbi:hypothetical protein BC937DRAFT_95173 [Endogone sp. FLAS-F59071]|nr:hypothetical protein BC937DRAFT_95173 [Endogone sp. FLAS-F59071]|eukprot:RUS13532.1 hypothetical protein BC937DRAFT_95173 [Endogone sp. FLAS-F59071]
MQYIQAFDNVWSKIFGKQRGWLIIKPADLMEAHAEELAQIETLDNGKGITYSHAANVPEAIQCFCYYAD